MRIDSPAISSGKSLIDRKKQFDVPLLYSDGDVPRKLQLRFRWEGAVFELEPFFATVSESFLDHTN